MVELSAEQVLAEVAAAGSIKDAAEKLGIPRTTLSDRYHKALKAGAEPAGKVVDLPKRVKELEKLVESQQRRIANFNAVDYKLPKAIKPSDTDDAYCRVIIPDTHGCYVDEAALAAFLYDLEQLSPAVREVVMLGDRVDVGGFLSAKHTWGYVPEGAYTYEDDINACAALLDKLQKTCPAAQFHYLEGNHEARVEKWCMDQASSTADAELLLRGTGPRYLLKLDERGIKYYHRNTFYDDLLVPAAFKLGHCYFTHGARAGANPAKAVLGDFGANVVFGHVHRMDSYSARTVSEGVIGAWSPGCLCRLQPLWNNTQITGWNHGYALQFVRGDGTFMHVNVPIIGGKSYLTQLTTRLSS